MFFFTNNLNKSQFKLNNTILFVQSIKKQSGIELSDMIFFDDESRNIRDLAGIGVVSILVNSDGVTKSVVDRGLKEFTKQRS